MSSDPPDPNELLKFLLAQQQQQHQQQQQQQQHGAAPFAPQPQYQPPPQQMAPPPPAPPQQQQAPPQNSNPSLSQLLEFLQSQASSQAPAPAPTVPKPQQNYEQLQRYLRANGVVDEQQQQHQQHQHQHHQQQAPAPQHSGYGYPIQHQPPPMQPPIQHRQQQQQQQQPVPQVQLPQAHRPPQPQPPAPQQPQHPQGLTLQQQAQQVLNQLSSQNQNLTLRQRQDNLLASVKLLAELNPGMAAVAVMQALNMPSPAPQAQTHQVPQQQASAPPQIQQQVHQQQASAPPQIQQQVHQQQASAPPQIQQQVHQQQASAPHQIQQQVQQQQQALAPPQIQQQVHQQQASAPSQIQQQVQQQQQASAPPQIQQQIQQQSPFQQQPPQNSFQPANQARSFASAPSPFLLGRLRQNPRSTHGSARRGAASAPPVAEDLANGAAAAEVGGNKGIMKKNPGRNQPPTAPRLPVPPPPPPVAAAAVSKVPASTHASAVEKGLAPPPPPDDGIAGPVAGTALASRKPKKKESASPAKAPKPKKPARREEKTAEAAAPRRPEPQLHHPPVLPPIPNPDKAALQSWSLDQLEMHVQQLKHARQPVPQHVAVLLFNTRRKEEKRKAKRLANRKSATISRMRKKAFIEDMTKDNARLRKRATILKFLPDLVIATNMEGDITFCGSQVEKVLRYKTDELRGANIEQIVVPNSRRTMQRLIQDLVSTTEQQDPSGEAVSDGDRTERNGSANRPDRAENEGNNSNGSSDANVISLRSSEKSFPMLEVNVDAVQTSAGEDVSDSSADRRSKKEKDGGGGKHKSKGNDTTTEISSLTRQKSSFGTETKSSFGSETSTGDENGEPPAKKVKISAAQEKTNCGESDESTSSRKAGDRITNNVDDVMGASVTANNADAKLSSLMHYPKIMQSKESRKNLQEAQQPGLHHHQKHVMKQPGSSPKTSEERSLSSIAESSQSRTKKRGGNSESEDSGYRESNESPEESNESPEESSSSSVSSEAERGKNRVKRQRLVPVYKVCFIRADLTTVWCEVTSSICTRSFFDDESSFDPKAALAAIQNPRGIKSAESSGDTTVPEEEEEVELILSLRPTFEGKKIGEEFRFTPGMNTVNESEATSLSDEKAPGVPTSSSGNDLSINASSVMTGPKPGRPLKKRPFECEQESKGIDESSPSKKHKALSRQASATGQDVKTVAESLMLMSHHAM